MRKPKMRKLLYLMLIVVLVLVGGWRVFTLVDDDDEEGNAFASVPEKTTSAPTTEHIWPEYRTVGDIPIYPGADPLHLTAKDREAFDAKISYFPSMTQYENSGRKFFVTDDNVAQVTSFYKDTMPDHGWEASAEAAGWTFWQTHDLERGAAIILIPQGSETILSMWLGEGYIPPSKTEGNAP